MNFPVKDIFIVYNFSLTHWLLANIFSGDHVGLGITLSTFGINSASSNGIGIQMWIATSSADISFILLFQILILSPNHVDLASLLSTQII
jgi:hypothetical protein